MSIKVFGKKIGNIVPVKIQFEDDTFELTTAIINPTNKILTCSINIKKKGTSFKALGVDDKGSFFELICQTKSIKGTEITASWKKLKLQ